jgi:predicted HicB family RNase H-like nuclease
MPQVQTEQVKFVLRLPPSLHKKIKRRAKTNNTSMNKEITNVLSDAMSGTGVEKALEDLIYRLEKKKVI